MKKEDILALIETSIMEAKFALEREDIVLTDDERNLISDRLVRMETFKERFIAEVPEDDEKMIESYYRSFNIALSDLVSFRRKKEIEAGINRGENASKDSENKEENKENSTALIVAPSREIAENEHKIVRVIPEEKQEEQTKKDRDNLTKHLRRIFYVLGSVAAVAIIASAIKYYVNHSEERTIPDEPTASPSVTVGPRVRPGWNENDLVLITPEPQIVNRVANVDINNYEELMEYASQIQSSLKDTKLSVDDIMYAIRMANWDYLEDKSFFTDREGVCRSTYNTGVITTELGSDAIVKKDVNTDIFITDMQMADILMCVTDNALTKDDFESAKVEDRGYDIYAVMDRCIAGMYAHKDSIEEEDIAQDTLYAKVFNDVVARAVVNFSIVNSDEAPLCTMYTVLGTYTSNKERILDLTKHHGPIYGTGPRIDGNYGNICTLELVTLTNIDTKDINNHGNYIGNEKCIFYTDFIDEVIINQEQNQSLGLN